MNFKILQLSSKITNKSTCLMFKIVGMVGAMVEQSTAALRRVAGSVPVFRVWLFVYVTFLCL